MPGPPTFIFSHSCCEPQALELSGFMKLQEGDETRGKKGRTASQMALPRRRRQRGKKGKEKDEGRDE